MRSCFSGTLLKIGLFVCVCIIWGTTWFAMSEAALTIPPILANALRFVFTAPIMLAIAFYCKKPVFFPKGQQYWMFFISIFYFAIPFALMVYAEKYISPGLAAIIFANLPIAVMLLCMFVSQLKLKIHQVIGLILACLSLIFIIKNEMGAEGIDYAYAVGAMALAAFLHALVYSLVEKHCGHIDVITYNAMPCFLASVFLFVASFVFESVSIAHISQVSFIAVVYLGTVAGVGGIFAYFQLNKLVSPFQASICFLIFPLVALEISSLTDGATISFTSWLLMIPLLFGIVLTKYKANK